MSRSPKPAALLLTASRAMAETPDCAADPRSAPCTLDHTLHLLYWAAGIMAVLFTIVLLLALAVYRKNKSSRLTPNG